MAEIRQTEASICRSLHNFVESKLGLFAFTLLFAKVGHADGHGHVYLVDFICEPSAYVEFASMTLEVLDAQFPKGSTKLARYHDLKSGSGIVLIETDDPTLAIKHVNPWSGMCDSTITPVVNDKKALEILPKQ
ncbi:DUF3303 domain-containing protein [Gammaproteobacteria bacterium]|nr:DUF3303 domain-containing protein [Gammaproteobacteria bacterium]